MAWILLGFWIWMSSVDQNGGKIILEMAGRQFGENGGNSEILSIRPWTLDHDHDHED